jgi:hypothetical protein
VLKKQNGHKVALNVLDCRVCGFITPRSTTVEIATEQKTL